MEWSDTVKTLMVIIVMAGLLFIAVPVPAQETTYPFECVADADNLVLSTWGISLAHYEISAEQWQSLTQMTGDSVWIGYPVGWDVPSDIVGAWKIEGDIDGEPMTVWIWASESTNMYYMFPFANTELFADKNGDHYGIHPCGGWAVDSIEIMTIINEVVQ